MTIVTPADQAAQHAATLRAQTRPITWTVRNRTEQYADRDTNDARIRAILYSDCAGDVPAADLAPLVTLVSDETGIDVARKLDGTGYVVAWTDHVANEWDETHTDLSVALARLAMLQRCAESGWERGFNETPDEFAAAAAAFLDHGTA